MSRAALLALAGAAVLPAAGSAQVCTAASSFERHAYRVLGTAAVGDSITFIGGGFRVGSNSVFGNAMLGHSKADELHGFRLRRVNSNYAYEWVYDGAMTAQLGAGYQLPLGSSSRFQLCPTVELSFVFGPDSLYGSDLGYGEGSLSLGVSLGGVLVRSRAVSLAAAASLAGVYSSQSYEDSFGSADVDRSMSGFAGLALGFAVGDALTVRPSVAVPFARHMRSRPIGVRDGSTRYALTVALSIGPPAR